MKMLTGKKAMVRSEKVKVVKKRKETVMLTEEQKDYIKYVIS